MADPRPARWIRRALVASIVLNVALLALIGGAALHGPPGGRGTAFGPYTEALSKADRRALRHDFLEAPLARSAARGDLAAVTAALRAEPFDPRTLEAAVARQADHATARLRLGQSLLVARMTAMPAADRVRLADRLDARRR